MGFLNKTSKYKKVTASSVERYVVIEGWAYGFVDGEIIEAEVLSDGSVKWDEGGIVDSRSGGGHAFVKGMDEVLTKLNKLILEA